MAGLLGPPDGFVPHPEGYLDPASRLAGAGSLREVTAVIRFAEPQQGRERDAALAWGFELRYYFGRGVGERAPGVSFSAGVYTCTGQITTTHPGDKPVTDFTPDEPWNLAYCASSRRRDMLRELWAKRIARFDGTR
jgi:hypothetical protein